MSTGDISGIYTVSNTFTVPANGSRSYGAIATTGDVVLGGGYGNLGTPDLTVTGSQPWTSSDGAAPYGWLLWVTNSGSSDRDVTAYAVCAKVDA